MSDMSRLTDRQLDAALRVDDVPLPADLGDLIRAAIERAPLPTRTPWQRFGSVDRRPRSMWLVVAGVLIGALIAAVALAGLAERPPEVRVLTAELDRGADPTRTMPVRIRDVSGLVIGGETMDRSMPEWLQAQAAGLSLAAPVQFANPPGDAARVVVVLLADGACDASLDLSVSGGADRLRLIGSLVAGSPDCGGTIGPMWFALRFREPIAASEISGELTRAGEATASPGVGAEFEAAVSFPDARSVPVTIRAPGVGIRSVRRFPTPGP